MIIALMLVAVIIGAVICCNIDSKTRYDCLAPAVILIVLGFFGAIFVSFGIIDAQVNRDVKYQNVVYEKEMLEYRIKHMEENITGNEMLYSDIVEFNNELRSVKKWANNPWTNWFYNQDVATIEYIEIDIG